MEPLKAVINLSMGRMIHSRRTMIMALLALLPIVLAIFAVAVVTVRQQVGQTGFGLATEQFNLIFLHFLLLVVTLFYGTSLLGDEIDDKTITYLFVRPVPRATIYLGKFLSGVLMASLLVLPSAIVTFGILSTLDPPSEVFAHVPIFAQDLVILILGTAVYCSVYGFLGTYFKYPLLIGIIFTLVWESVVTYIPGYIHRFTVLHYLQSLLPHASGQRGIQQIFGQPTSPLVSVITLLLIGGGFLALSCWTISRKEYVLPA